jgi:hypothetical protein
MSHKSILGIKIILADVAGLAAICCNAKVLLQLRTIVLDGKVSQEIFNIGKGSCASLLRTVERAPRYQGNTLCFM